MNAYQSKKRKKDRVRENIYSVIGILFIVFPGCGTVAAQSGNWGVSAFAGTSANYVKGDTLTKQGLLLPTFGAAAFYQVVLGTRFFLKPSLGYMNRGTVTHVDAYIDADREKTLGSYTYTSRDHFLSSDLLLCFQPWEFSALGAKLHFNTGVRNDFYVLTNYKEKSGDPYFKPASTSLQWHRSNHHRPYIVGVLGYIGLKFEALETGFEYYSQVFGSYAIPVENRAHYSQLFSHSLQLSVSYHF